MTIHIVNILNRNCHLRTLGMTFQSIMISWPLKDKDDQAPVVQTLDSAIHRINHYLADKYYRNQLRYLLDRALSGG